MQLLLHREEILPQSHQEASARKIVAEVCDPSSNHAGSHSNRNDLRTKMPGMKDVSLAKLPPCESVFREKVLRAMWQIKLWVHVPFPELCAALTPYGVNGAEMLEPVMYTEPTTSE